MKRFSLFSLAGLVLSGLIFLPLAFSQTNETLIISTYYPSPYGVYNELRLYPKATLSASPCSDLYEGTMYYDKDTQELRVCNGIGGWGWKSISLWTLSGTDLYPNNSTWNVGIGTTVPAAEKLDVAGNIHGAHIKSGNLTSVNNGFSGWASTGEGFLGLGFSNGRSLVFGMDSSNNIGMGIRQGAIPYAVFAVSGADNSWNFRSWNNMSFATSGLYPTPSIFVSGSNGNVGIGTTIPGAKLEVAGQVKITGGSPGAGKVLTSDGSGLASWQSSSGGGGCNWTGWKCHCNADLSGSNEGYVTIGMYCSNSIMSDLKVMNMHIGSSGDCPSAVSGCDIYTTY
jgi:hypothetical protein